MFDTPRLRLWARMIVNINIHVYDDLVRSPCIPAFGFTPRKPRQESFSSAISGAAIAFEKSIRGNSTREMTRGIEALYYLDKQVYLRIELRMKSCSTFNNFLMMVYYRRMNMLSKSKTFLVLSESCNLCKPIVELV